MTHFINAQLSSNCLFITFQNEDECRQFVTKENKPIYLTDRTLECKDEYYHAAHATVTVSMLDPASVVISYKSDKLDGKLIEYLEENHPDACDYKRLFNERLVNADSIESNAQAQNAAQNAQQSLNKKPKQSTEPHRKEKTQRHQVPVRESVPNAAPSRFSFLDKITQFFSNFYKAPSMHPVTLAAISALTVVAFSGSILATLAVGATVFVGLQARHNLYLPTGNNQNQTFNRDNQRAKQEGREAGKSWTAYFKSFKSTNSWKHPVSFGDGLIQEMYKNTKKNR